VGLLLLRVRGVEAFWSVFYLHPLLESAGKIADVNRQGHGTTLRMFEPLVKRWWIFNGNWPIMKLQAVRFRLIYHVYYYSGPIFKPQSLLQGVVPAINVGISVFELGMSDKSDECRRS